MPAQLPSFVLGYHGCDLALARQVVNESKPFRPSRNDYDWLGSGIYFWENSAERAMQWAGEAASRSNSKVETPAVIGAVLDLGHCLNLLEEQWLRLLPSAHEEVEAIVQSVGRMMPHNRLQDVGGETLLRPLDCLVINHLCDVRQPAFDSVRAAFIEGSLVYPGSGIRRRNHIQICIRNPDCIRGCFHPPELRGT